MRRDVEGAYLGSDPGGTAGMFRAAFRFDPGLPLFAGHFPGRPLLPGVVQLEMVRYAVERALSCRLEISKLLKVKFNSPVRPGERVELEAAVSEVPDGTRVKATVRAEGRVAASMTLVLAPWKAAEAM